MSKLIDVFYEEPDASSFRIKESLLNKILGARLRERRKFMGFNQSELGEKLQISGQQIHKYEAGIDQLSASKIYELCDYLQVTASYFFENLEGYQLSEDEQVGFKSIDCEEVRLRKYIKIYQDLSEPQLKKLLFDLIMMISSQLKALENLMNNSTSKTRASRK